MFLSGMGGERKEGTVPQHPVKRIEENVKSFSGNHCLWFFRV